MISGRTIEDDRRRQVRAGRSRRRRAGQAARPRAKARDAFAGVRSAGAGDAAAEAAARRRLGARDQVRRLSPAGADPGRQGEAADPQRPGLDGDASATAVPAALAALPARTAILDGELVVEGAGGASDFSALQADLLGRAQRPLRLYAVRPALPRRRGSARARR